MARYHPCNHGILCQKYKDNYPNPDIETLGLAARGEFVIGCRQLVRYILVYMPAKSYV